MKLRYLSSFLKYNPYIMSCLNEEQRALLKMIDSFSKDEIAPIADSIDKTNVFPRHIFPKLGKLGLLGITANDFGGSNLGYLEHVLVMETISKYSGSIGLSYGAHSNLCINQIARNASPFQRSKYLPKLIGGEHIGALAMSELEAGSDVMSMKMKANKSKDGKYYILNGSKMWITNGEDADIIIVYAKIINSQIITSFIVTKELRGISIGPKMEKLGMRGSSINELHFNNVHIPVENILGEEDKGGKILMSGLDYERIVLAAGPVGIMQSCMDLVLPYVHERKQFKQEVGKFQLIQSKLANMHIRLSTARVYLYATARAIDSGITDSKECAAVILYCAKAATQQSLDAIQCLGGIGYMNECRAGRLLRDSKLYEIGAGTSEIRRVIIGREYNRLFSQ